MKTIWKKPTIERVNIKKITLGGSHGFGERLSGGDFLKTKWKP